MRKIKEVLRLKPDAKLAHEKIAAALSLSKGEACENLSISLTGDLGTSVAAIISCHRNGAHAVDHCRKRAWFDVMVEGEGAMGFF